MDQLNGIKTNKGFIWFQSPISEVPAFTKKGKQTNFGVFNLHLLIDD